MPLAPADLLQPNGPVDPSFFPDDAAPPATGAGSLNDRLQIYINRAVAKVGSYPSGTFNDTDGAVELWALWLTFDAAHAIKLAAPASENTGEMGLGSTTYLAQQIAKIEEKAVTYRRSFEALVAAGSVTPTTPPTPTAVPASFTF